MLTTWVFLLGAGAMALLLVASMLMSPRPQTLCQHILGIARLTVLTGTVAGIARLVTAGAPPNTEQAVLMVGLAVLYGLQTRFEVRRQARS